MFSPRLKPLALALLISLPSFTAYALQSDSAQPIHIAADKALRDEKQGITTYSGNVQMSQGSLHIDADTVTIHRIVEEGDKIVATGRPARLRQQPDPEKGPVTANANTIEYYKSEQRVHLRDKAFIEQDGSTVAGNTIDYFIAEQLVKADSGKAEDGSNRVQVVIPASAIKESEAENGTTNSQ